MIKLPFRLLLALALLAGAGAAWATRITPAMTGTWHDPAYDQQGFIVEVLDAAGDRGARTVLVYWFTYDDAGAPVWAVGAGPALRDTVTVEMVRTFGGARPPIQRDADAPQDFATVTLTFGNCQRAAANFAMAADGATGHYDLDRLTRIGASRCTGGMGDEMEPGARPVTIGARLAPTDVQPAASGQLRFVQRPAYASFVVDTHHLAVGSYRVVVDGVIEGEFESMAPGQRGDDPDEDEDEDEDEDDDGDGDGDGDDDEGDDANDRDARGTKGSLTFASPAVDEDPLLDFDPRGVSVEIIDAQGQTVLHAEFPAAEHSAGTTPSQ